MKTSLFYAAGRNGSFAFTLPEMMISLAVFGVALGGALSTQMFGLRMYQIAQPKMGANHEARKAIANLVDEIHTAAIIRVGQGDLNGFQEVDPDEQQIGSALEIYPTTDTNNWIRYYYDPADRTLKKTRDGQTAYTAIAHEISTNTIFTAEDYSGTVLTNNYNNRVIGLTLQFSRIEYPVTPIGPGQLYDYYRLRTKITRRSIQ